MWRGWCDERLGDWVVKQSERRELISDLTPEQKLLLLCSRVSLSERQVDWVRQTASAITDWQAFCASTVPHRLAALVNSHLKSHCAELLPENAKAALQKYSMQQAMGYLKIAAAQKRLNQEIMQPSEVRHVFFKGIGLAEEYYPTAGHRPCRDIDLWIDPEGMAEVWARMEAAGYRRLEKPDGAHRIPVHHAAFLLPTIDVLTPDGTLVEIHMKFDHSGLTLNADEIYRRSVMTRGALGAFRVPDIEDHFIYVCLHHTRHLWARLRWLVDLDAFEKHPRFDRERVRERMENSCVEKTVNACFDLYDQLAEPHETMASTKWSAGEDLLYWVHSAAVHGPDELNEAARDRRVPDFALRWQYSRWYGLRVRLQRLKPTQADYLAAPLDRDQWWRYYLSRPFRLARQYFGAAKAVNTQ